MMAWTPLIYIFEIFMEPMNPMDQGPMELQDNKDTETLILKGSNIVSAKASLAGKETGKHAFMQRWRTNNYSKYFVNF